MDMLILLTCKDVRSPVEKENRCKNKHEHLLLEMVGEGYGEDLILITPHKQRLL